MSVELLVRQAKAGDHKARRLLAEQLRVRVERMAHYYASRSGEEYEDLLQEAWLTLFQALQDVNFNIGSPSCYLLKRAKWRMLDVIKSNRRRQHASLADFEETYPSTQNAASDGLAVSPLGLLLAALFAIVIGLSAGVYPALRASRLTPVDAIRAL